MGYPLNIKGRLGVALRGVLGRWGPNHAVDPVVTRWQRDASNQIVVDSKTNRPILQFLAILRKDVQEWAIPGVSFVVFNYLPNLMFNQRA